jgi:hypothetical protein
VPTCSPTLPIWDDVVRCSLAFGCKARFKRAVKREAALVEERREPACLTRNPTSATLTPQMMRKRTPITICSFLFPTEGTVRLARRSMRRELLWVADAISAPFIPYTGFHSPSLARRKQAQWPWKVLF